MSTEGANAKSSLYSVQQYKRSRLKNRHKNEENLQKLQVLDIIFAKNLKNLSFKNRSVCFCSVLIAASPVLLCVFLIYYLLICIVAAS